MPALLGLLVSDCDVSENRPCPSNYPRFIDLSPAENSTHKPDGRRFPSWLTPLFGCLTGLSIAGYAKLFGGGATAMQIAAIIVLSTAAGKILSFMDDADNGELQGTTPNAALTVVLLIASALLFWIPAAGLVLISYAMYRSRWLNISDWILFLFACLFILSAAVTIVWGVIISIEN